jgi:Tfp pilus assembly protein PilF
MSGSIKDEKGQPIRGATIILENPAALPRSFTTTTDDKGRFAVIGLRSGNWSLTAQAPGFIPTQTVVRATTNPAQTPNVMLSLTRGVGATGTGLLAGVNPKDLLADLQSASKLFNDGKLNEAIAAYQAIATKAPALTLVNMQIANIYRQKNDYDSAAKYYERAAELDPASSRPILELGLMALNKGDRDEAARLMEKVLSVNTQCAPAAATQDNAFANPRCADSVEAQSVLERLKK